MLVIKKRRRKMTNNNNSVPSFFCLFCFIHQGIISFWKNHNHCLMENKNKNKTIITVPKKERKTRKYQKQHSQRDPVLTLHRQFSF
jgi:hypothetical protein